MTGDHHGRTARRATLLVTATDDILGTHRAGRGSFTADGIALAGFLAGLAAGQYDPGVFTSAPGNIFEGRDVTAVALQVPDADLGGTRIAVWARISLFGHAPQLQISRIGQAMLRPLFFSPPDAESETLNAGAPASDTDAHGKRVLSIADTAARLAGLADPDAYAERVLAAFLPDVVRYQPGSARLLPARRWQRART